MPSEPLLTTSDVAAMLKTTTFYVCKLITTGQLRASNIRTPKCPLYRIRLEDVETFMEKTRVIGVEE